MAFYAIRSNSSKCVSQIWCSTKGRQFSVSRSVKSHGVNNLVVIGAGMVDGEKSITLKLKQNSF